MNYALIKDGVVNNIIWLSPSNAQDFPNAIKTNGLPICVGDTYTDGMFYRDGEKVLSVLEQVTKELDIAEATIAELDAVLLDYTYENIIENV